MKRSSSPNTPSQNAHAQDAPDRRVALISAEGLECRIANHRVVGPLDFEVNCGELVALVGPNGAGKSTLLAALAGDMGSTGDVRICSKPISSISPRQLARLRAVLPQGHNVTFPYRTLEVVSMGRTPWLDDGDPGGAGVVESEMVATDVVDLGERVFNTLSGGEQARAALARTFAQRTPIILLDEPTAALDIHHQEQIFALIRAKANEGCGVVAVVHDLELAAAYADRIVVLDAGRIAIEGSPSVALDADVLSQVYRHRISVIEHELSGGYLVVPQRGAPAKQMCATGALAIAESPSAQELDLNPKEN